MLDLLDVLDVLDVLDLLDALEQVDLLDVLVLLDARLRALLRRKRGEARARVAFGGAAS